ncbi:hypothetical protein AB0383_49780 [Amycolatopsis sp. NPDC051373]|uniref:hypothetical protein n=1 Tax=Amycolatopsis sp. NPDC051373 TaxID=3155801 RepID=UPI00344F73F2
MNDDVVIPLADYKTLLRDACRFRQLASSPHVAELVDELEEWQRRRTLREASNAISAAADWRREATVPTFAELEKRRAHSDRPAQTPAQIKASCAWSWRAFERHASLEDAA